MNHVNWRNQSDDASAFGLVLLWLLFSILGIRIQLCLLLLVELLDLHERLVAIHDRHVEITNDKLQWLDVHNAFELLGLDAVENVV